MTSLLLFLPSMLNAASIRLSPVSVEILSDQAASSISLYNQSNESADLQVRVFEWRQNAGQDQLIPTDEIVISPPFLKLQPSDSYNLRVVRINPELISGEKLIVLLLMSYQNQLIVVKLIKGLTYYYVRHYLYL